MPRNGVTAVPLALKNLTAHIRNRAFPNAHPPDKPSQHSHSNPPARNPPSKTELRHRFTKHFMTSRIDHVLNNPAALLLEAGDVVLSADAVTLTSSGILTGIFTALVVTIGIRLRPRAVATRLGLALDIGMIALAQISSCLAAWMLILLVDSVHQGESDNIGFVQRFGLFMGPCIAVFYCGAIAIRTALTARYRKWRLEYDNEVPMEKTDSPV